MSTTDNKISPEVSTRNTMDKSQRLKVISRNSPLALLQVEELFCLFPEINHEVTAITSYGDKHKELSLMGNIATDFFTQELDEALLQHHADIAVHSAKDLPYPLPDGLELFCLTVAADKSDSLVSRDNKRLKDLPPGSRVGTSSKMRKAELMALRSDIEVVSIRGNIGERIAQVDNGHIDALIVATCALIRLGLEGRIAERLPFRTHPLQGHLAVVGRAGDTTTKARFARHDIRRNIGAVTLVGFGPGRADLLTLAGDKALKEADVVFYDDLIDSSFLTRYTAKRVYVGKRCGKHSHTQDEINELLYQAAVSGQRTVRLKGGDPMIFAHGREEIDFLESRLVDVDVIPGISAAIAMAACTKIPLTHRGVASSVAFVTGHGKTLRTPSADTLVYYMGGARLSEIAADLIRSGQADDTPVAIVCSVSRPEQRVFFSTIEELQHTVLKYPTPVILVIGQTVNIGRHLPTRQITLDTATVSANAKPNENITHTPLITITHKPLTLKERHALETYDYAWIIFTSRYGVRHFFNAIDEAGIALRRYANAQIASVGPITTA